MRQADMLAAAIESFQKAELGEPVAMRYQATAWLAMALLARDDRAGALKSAQSAVQTAPDSGLARGNLALALLFNDRAHDAAKEARRATQLNPDSVAARVALAQSLLAKGDTDAAAREAALAAALDPDLPQGLYVLGLADAARRDYSHAARELEQSLKTAPDFLPSASALARVYTQMGREREAVTLLTDFQTRHPQSSEVLAALGQVYYQQGKYHNAVEQYQKAIAKQPNSALYQAELARLLLDDNQLNASLQAAQRAVFLAPEIGQYHAMLGLVADFSGLAAYADREYRTAIALDPQNALARARIGLNSAGDPRTGFNTTTQAFLYDPSISRQLFRGGVQGEVTVSAGSDHALGVLSGHRLQSEDGRIYEYGIESAKRSDGFDDAPNDDTRQYGILELINIVPDNHTNILVRGSATKNEFGFNAPTSSLDNRSEVALPRASIGMRRRIGQKHHLWAGVRYDSIRARDTDPNSDSFFFDFINPFLLVTENQELRARVIEPELRLDLDLGETPGRSTLSFGTSYTKQRTFFRQDVTFRDITTLNPPLPLGRQDGDGTRRVRLYYAQLAHRLNDKTSFVAQLRRQDVKSTLSSVFLGIPQGTAVTDTSDILPSLLINHQLNNKTALRFYAYRSKFDSGLQTFAPTETLLASENSVFPLGASDQVRLYELEAEHYFSPRTFGKLFVFRSRANGLTIGGLALDETTRTGVGVRLEHRIGHNLFSSLLLSRNRTTSQTAGMNFSGQSPYQPRYLARVALNYVAPGGNRAGIAVNYTGSFFQDSLLTGTNRPRFPSKTTVDLRLAHEPSLKNEIFFNVINVFNADQIVANGVPAPGRRFEVGWTRRF
jgi:tetratricopeptide (TPR) repeat protein